MLTHSFRHLAAPALALCTAMILSACGAGDSATTPSSTFSSPTVADPNAVLAVSSTPVEGKAVQPGRELSGRLGANLAPIYDWSRTHEFVDLMRQARPFGPADTPWSSVLPVGPDGWPTQDFGVILMANQWATKGLGGVYKIRFTGQATVRLNSSAGSLSAPSYDPATGVTTIDYTFPEGGDQMLLSFYNTQGSVKNLKVIRPGYDPVNPPTFTSHFLQHIQRFAVLRTMDWQLTNANPLVRWEDRPTPANTRTTSPKYYGIDLETIIQLGNESGKDLWIHVPFGADDTYVRNMAQLLRDTLNPNVRIYLEYSNELWNMGFKQAKDNMAAAKAEVAANPASVLAVGGETWDYAWAARRVAKRTIEIADIFASVYGQDAINTRVRPVLASQLQGQWQWASMLDMVKKAYPKAPKDYFYGIAGAPYFNLDASPYGGSNLQWAEGSTPEQLLNNLSITAKAELNYAYTNMENIAYLTRHHGLRMLSYEGGPDTFGTGSVLAKRDANLDQRFYPICRQFLADWEQSGGEMFMYFYAGAYNYRTFYGQWSVTEDMQDYSVKLQCLDDFRAAKQVASKSRHDAPVVFPTKETVGRSNTTNAAHYYKDGQTNDYVFSAPEAGVYKISVQTGVAAATMDVVIDGVKAGQIQLPKTTPENWWPWTNGTPPPLVQSTELAVQLDAGVHALQLVFRTPYIVNTYVPAISIQR